MNRRGTAVGRRRSSSRSASSAARPWAGDSSAIVAARSGSKGSPATAAASSSVRLVREGRELLGRDDARRRGTTGRVDAPPASGASTSRRRTSELLEIERVAAAMLVDRRRGERVELVQQLARLRLVELLERDPPHGRPRGRPIGAGAPAPAERQRQQDRASAPRRNNAPSNSIEAPSHQCRSSRAPPGACPPRVAPTSYANDGEARWRLPLVGDRTAVSCAWARSDGDDLGELGDRLSVPVAAGRAPARRRRRRGRRPRR